MGGNIGEIRKMKQGMSYTVKEKVIIMNVFKYFQKEYPELRITEIVRRTARATGCSEKSIFQFRKEETSRKGFKAPLKTKIRKNLNINSRDIKYDSEIRQIIRDTIYNLQNKSIVPSLNTLLTHLKSKNDVPKFSLMTLRRLLFDMGFYYEKKGSKYVLVENRVTEDNHALENIQAKCIEKPRSANVNVLQEKQNVVSTTESMPTVVSYHEMQPFQPTPFTNSWWMLNHSNQYGCDSNQYPNHYVLQNPI